MEPSSESRFWVVLGHFGGSNSGDEAMLLGLVMGCLPQLRKRLLVVTKIGDLPPDIAQYGVRTIPAQIRPVWKAINRCEGVILGGGTHFHDDYVRTRYIRHVRYLLRYLFLFSWAKLLGKKVLWLGVGVGPISRPLTQWLLRWGVLLCDHVTVRDAVSAAEVAAHIEPQKLTHAFDLAALTMQENLVPSRRTSPEQLITLGVSVVEANSSKTGHASLQIDFWTIFTEALADIYRQSPQLQIQVFVMRGGTREDDQSASQALVERLQQVDSKRVTLVPYHECVSVTIARIAECDCFIATRFHAAVLSYLVGSRLLFLAYHRKLHDIAKEIGLSPTACIDIAQPTTANDIINALKGLIGDSPNHVAKLPVEEAQYQAGLNITIVNRFSGV